MPERRSRPPPPAPECEHGPTEHAIVPENDTDATDTEADDASSMREQIIEILVEALRKQGHPTLTRETIAEDDAHRKAFIDMLGDCRPLPVVRQLMEDAKHRRL